MVMFSANQNQVFFQVYYYRHYSHDSHNNIYILICNELIMFSAKQNRVFFHVY